MSEEKKQKKEQAIPQSRKVKATCECGAEFEILSTLEKVKVEVCSQCHPFYTGQAKTMDTAGRVEKFKKRFAAKK